MSPNSNDAPPSARATDYRERAERHAAEAERLLASRWLASHVKGVLHATLAVYYASRLDG
jgi:hypothetical protein